MEDKTFELMEKLYSELISFKVEINKKVDKNTILLEKMNDHIQILAEVQQNHLEINYIQSAKDLALQRAIHPQNHWMDASRNVTSLTHCI